MSDEILPGYTRISRLLDAWSSYDKIPKDILRDKQQIGSEVHEAIELHQANIGVGLSQRAAPYFESWQSWLYTTKAEIVYTELRLYDKKLKITGCIDSIVKMPHSDALVLVDYKTCFSSHEKKWSLQGTFYHHLCKVNGYQISDDIIFVQLDKDGKFPKCHCMKANTVTWDACKALLYCFRYLGVK